MVQENASQNNTTEAALALLGKNVTIDSGIMLQYGDIAAMLLSYLAYFTEYELRYGKPIEGRYWVRASESDFLERYPGLTRGKVRKAIANLVEQEALFVNHFNKRPGDKTKWYSINGEEPLLAAYRKLISSKYVDKNTYKTKKKRQQIQVSNNQDYGSNNQDYGSNNQDHGSKNQAIDNTYNNNIYNNHKQNNLNPKRVANDEEHWQWG